MLDRTINPKNMFDSIKRCMNHQEWNLFSGNFQGQGSIKSFIGPHLLKLNTLNKKLINLREDTTLHVPGNQTNKQIPIIFNLTTVWEMLLTLIISQLPSTVMAITTNITPYISSPLISSQVLIVCKYFVTIFSFQKASSANFWMSWRGPSWKRDREMIMCGDMQLFSFFPNKSKSRQTVEVVSVRGEWNFE